MKRVLLVKMSSLGDVIHTLPALGDAAAAQPGIRFDWVVEEAFAEIPGWHPAVDQVIPVALRRWRRRPLGRDSRRGWRHLRETLTGRRYDSVIDAQGLIKSALVSRLARAPRCGPDRHSAREALAAAAYDRALAVPRNLHAVERTRLLFASALGYSPPTGRGDYGLRAALPAATALPPGLLLFHGTARAEKLWPEAHWIALAERAAQAGLRLWLPWGSEAERERAGRIAAAVAAAEVLPRLSLAEIAARLRGARAAVAVDTGLGHLAAALDVPAVSLYGPTDTRLVGTYGRNQVHIRSPLAVREGSDAAGLMAAITPAMVWRELQPLLDAGAG